MASKSGGPRFTEIKLSAPLASPIFVNALIGGQVPYESPLREIGEVTSPLDLLLSEVKPPA
jgi:hypothetical protein